MLLQENSQANVLRATSVIARNYFEKLFSHLTTQNNSWPYNLVLSSTGEKRAFPNRVVNVPFFIQFIKFRLFLTCALSHQGKAYQYYCKLFFKFSMNFINLICIFLQYYRLCQHYYYKYLFVLQNLYVFIVSHYREYLLEPNRAEQY